MAVIIDGRKLLYAEMFPAVIDSNMHNRLALNWQTPIKRRRVVSFPMLVLCAKHRASPHYFKATLLSTIPCPVDRRRNRNVNLGHLAFAGYVRMLPSTHFR